MKRVTTLLAVCAAIAAPHADAATPEERATSLTVRITTADNEGAGVIFHRDGDTVYIMTARHVVATSAPRPVVNVYFAQARNLAMSATVEPQQSERLDLAVLKVVAPQRSVGELDFSALGKVDSLTRGAQVYPVGHVSDQLRWWHPTSPVALSRRLGDQLTFEAGISKMTGFSGGGLFDSGWGLIGLISEDSPPETFALSIDAVLDQLRRWQYQVSLSPAGTRGPLPPGGVTFGTENFIYTPPLGWATIAQPDGSIILKKPDISPVMIILMPAQPLSRRFEDIFQDNLNNIPPQTLTTRAVTQRAQEGFNYRFVEGTMLMNIGGVTKPIMDQMHFLYIAFDPVGRYESVLYLADRYNFEPDRKFFDDFLLSLDFKNSQAERTRR